MERDSFDTAIDEIFDAAIDEILAPVATFASHCASY
jgi:hypothetical protein